MIQEELQNLMLGGFSSVPSEAEIGIGNESKTRDIDPLKGKRAPMKQGGMSLKERTQLKETVENVNRIL